MVEEMFEEEGSLWSSDKVLVVSKITGASKRPCSSYIEQACSF